MLFTNRQYSIHQIFKIKKGKLKKNYPPLKKKKKNAQFIYWFILYTILYYIIYLYNILYIYYILNLFIDQFIIYLCVFRLDYPIMLEWVER